MGIPTENGQMVGWASDNINERMGKKGKYKARYNPFLTLRSSPPLPEPVLPYPSLPVLPPMRNNVLHKFIIHFHFLHYSPKLATSLPRIIVGENWNVVGLIDEAMGNSNTHYEV